MNELYAHIQYVFFCVLVLKVIIMCYEPSLVVLKEVKGMCMSYIIINP